MDKKIVNAKQPVVLEHLVHESERRIALRFPLILLALLGHASSKTTEIYTHVSTRYLQGIVNPMDNLDTP